MVPDGTWQIICLIILLLSSAFFSASETALMTLSKIRLRNMVESKIKGANIVNKLLENPSKLLGGILVGNNIANIGASSLATSLAITHFKDSGVAIATIVMTILVLIFAEITPKSLAAQNSEKVALKIAKPLSLITFILNPLITVLIYITNTIIKILGGEVNKSRPFITEEELKTMVSVSHEEGMLEGEEKQMIYNVFDFRDSQAKDVMTPRTDMIVASSNSTYGELINVFRKEQFSRLPIYEDTVDNVIGVLYIKDLIFFEDGKEEFKIEKHMRTPYFTYEFKSTADLFADMRLKRIPISIILDEYGGTAGLVTFEDLVEEIVGDIDDEYDDDTDKIVVIKEDEFIVAGDTKISMVNEMIGLRIESDDFDSIGGFVTGLLGRLPKTGETINYNDTKFIVQDTSKNRIVKLKIIT
ncbi:HlyC/CorC family transporter [Clostridium estertheticum]|uniref:Hemolysin n=1 Tax=Clostridium estertheticum subsp. estertheticum TaxID=1552 RepID=A0A1J0GFS7_9CLOT|nr:hemolysin family protein [Clostridium estertheticum]APC39742.1 hemolysin [Clostridium estertheticum subsp. estertheticum]MBU3075750.1 hemolysin family protein [Clostridium estertheticum]MBU3165762.1 hemolysin family protein [Clostridium estertheticum]MBU3172099.1 hemolysin family protein [Clostridium estertheticum]MBZ9614214.1 hemolysin family protein [Clostridium estertheticum subsp. laramiense]